MMALNVCDLSGKLVLVTGAGTGIGRGIAMVLAQMGADVALHYGRSAEGACEAVDHIKASGGRAIAIQGDLEVVADCRRVVDEAAAFLGGLDGLVNNAGAQIAGLHPRSRQQGRALGPCWAARGGRLSGRLSDLGRI